MVCLENVLKISLQEVLKMSWRRLENVLKTSWRRLEDVFWRRKAKANIFVLIKTSWRRLLKTKTKDVFIKTNVWWVSCLVMKNIYLLIASFFFFKRSFFLIQKKKLFLVQVSFTHFCYCKSVICFLLKWMWRTSITSSSTAVNRLSFVFKIR